MRPERVLSADSHVTEPPNTYVDYIDSSWKDRAPHLVEHEKLGAIFVIDGMERPVPMGLIAAAGKPAEEIRVTGVRWEALHLLTLWAFAVVRPLLELMGRNGEFFVAHRAGPNAARRGVPLPELAVSVVAKALQPPVVQDRAGTELAVHLDEFPDGS